MAVDVLKSKGVPEDRILFLNLIASPEGVNNFAKKFPSLRVVTAFVDQGLDEKKYVQMVQSTLQTANSYQLYCAGIGRFRRSLLYLMSKYTHYILGRDLQARGSHTVTRVMR